MPRPPPRPTPFPYTTLFRSVSATDRERPMSDKVERMLDKAKAKRGRKRASEPILIACERPEDVPARVDVLIDRKSTRLNSSHMSISYAVFCLKKKKTNDVSR